MALDPDNLGLAKANARKILNALNAFPGVVEAYLASSDTTVAKFGIEVGSQPEFIYRLRRGVDLRCSTMRRVLEHMVAEDAQGA